MNAAERAQARALLAKDISVPRLIDDLEKARYGDLVLEHMRKARKHLSQAVLLHEEVIEPDEREACDSVIAALLAQASTKEFWGMSAGDVLNSISCDLNDELFSEHADDASIFIAFQITTLRLAQKAAEDSALRELIASSPLAAPERGTSGTITKMLGIAISDFDAGRLSRKNLLLILQDAIDNGDILELSNEDYVVTHVMPLIDEGVLTSSPAVAAFETRMDRRAMDFIRRKRGV